MKCESAPSSLDFYFSNLFCVGRAGFMKQHKRSSLRALESLYGRQRCCTFDSKPPPFVSKTQPPPVSLRREIPLSSPPVGFQLVSGRWARLNQSSEWHDLTFGVWFQSTYLSLWFYCSCTFSEPLSSIPALSISIYPAKLPLSPSHTYSHSFLISLKIFHSGK